MKLSLRQQRAFSLVEITVALGLIAFCLVALFGLLPIGLNSNQASAEQSTAANLATSIAADIWGAPKSGTAAKKSPRFKLTIQDGGGRDAIYLNENGTEVPNKEDAKYRAQVSIKKQENPVGRALMARIVISWPAGAEPASADGFFDTIIAYNP